MYHAPMQRQNDPYERDGGHHRSATPIITPEMRQFARDQQLRYALHSLQKIASGVEDPAKFAEIALKHINSELAPVAAQEDPLTLEIAEDARRFEESIGTNPKRRQSTVYPWGWCYVDPAIQEQFRLSCKKQKD